MSEGLESILEEEAGYKDVCPECGGVVFPTGSRCKSCQECGWSSSCPT